MLNMMTVLLPLLPEIIRMGTSLSLPHLICIHHASPSIPPYPSLDRAAICLANLINSRLGAAAVTPQSTSSSRSMSPNRSAARWRGQSPAGNTTGGPIPGLQLEELGLNDNPLLGSSGICALLGR
jgi:hypothetical protein